MKLLSLFFFILIKTYILSQGNLEFLNKNIPKRFETTNRLKFFNSLNCDSISSTNKFYNLTDFNLLTDKNGIGAKYLEEQAITDSLYYNGFLFSGLMKITNESKIKKIINYTDGPLNRIEYMFDSNQLLVNETHFRDGKNYFGRDWENGKIQCQNNDIQNGTTESFCISNGQFDFYSIDIKNNAFYFSKTYHFNSLEISSFRAFYSNYKICNEILEIDYYPGFLMSRYEYITKCSNNIVGKETTYFLNKKIKSEGNYIYPESSNFNARDKNNRVKFGTWKYYDLAGQIIKIVTYNDMGYEINCIGNCDQ